MYLNLNVSYANTLWCLAFGMFLCCYYCFGVRACTCVCMHVCVCLLSSRQCVLRQRFFSFILCVQYTYVCTCACLRIIPPNYSTSTTFSSFKDKSLAFTLGFSHRANCCPNYFCFLRFLLFDIWCEHSCNFGEHFYDYYAFWCFNLMKIAWLFRIWWLDINRH